ncbi:SusC/RagA family TonB-linked outer membrane protein [Pontibacter liquoris]|uniref:SusC/RagA family TonB-linked outer membrane protein n=1 Tax=Pontibacter liquoris TaxID=2905677 RepID=UPI001FA7B418|nr:TonB-dependent receptor [Pontibacter liquoris]
MKYLYYFRKRLLHSPGLPFLPAWRTVPVLLTLLFLCSFAGFAQTKHSVSGKVTSAADNSALPGVSIGVKGTATGAITDANGNFTVQAEDNAVLIVSYIGFKAQEVPVNGRSQVNVSLAVDQKVLDEVVVTGYGEVKRAEVTSAQTTIKSEEIQKTVNTTIEQAIQGRAAGVYVTQNTGQPGGGISVNIRGVNSITGSNEPLYVIDGVQMQPGNIGYGVTSSSNPLAGLNPADIESMEILQGPSATALYGSRGTNGVVLITTKRGKAGEMKVSYGYLYSLQDKPEELKTMNLRQYADMHNIIRRLTGGTPNVEFADPSILGEGTNWQEALFKTAALNKHQLSVSGGSDKTQFYLSGEYFNQEGVALGSQFDRYSLRLNVDNQTRKWLKVSTNLSVNQTNEMLGTSQENIIITALQMAPNVAVRNPDGSWAGPDESNGSSLQFTPLNPIAIANLVQNDLQRRGFIGGINAAIDIMKGLQFRTSLNGNAGFNQSTYFNPNYKLGGQPAHVATLSKSSGSNTYWNLNELLEYKHDFAKHSFTVMASHEAQASDWQNINGSRSGFVTNEVPELNLGNAQGQSNGSGRGDWAMESYLGSVNYSFADKYILKGTIRADGSANFGPESRWGYFPSVSAAWRISEEPFMKNNLSVINELKLRFETGITGNQGSGGIYGPLASTTTPWGTGFRLGTYGNPNLQWEETRTNNVGFNLNLFANRIQLEGDFYVKKTNNLLMQNPLPDYMGTASEGSIGAPQVNIGALQNKGYALSLNTINVDKGGFSWNTNLNVSAFRTKVTEFYSDAAIIDRVSWWMENWTQRAIVGEAPWLFRGYIQEGVFQSLEEIENSAVPANANGERMEINEASGVWVGDTKFKDLNGDNIIDEKDQTFIGNPWPKLTMGFTNTFAWKGFDATLLITGSFGNDIYNYVRYVNTNPNNINLGRNMLEDTYDYAKVAYNAAGEPYLENPGTNVPRISGQNANKNGVRHTSAYVEDGSYVRIKNLQIGYNLPASLLRRLAVVQGARLSVGVQNLATFTKYKGMDPEVGAYVGKEAQANSQSIGVDFGRYPITRMYTVSVGVDF